MSTIALDLDSVLFPLNELIVLPEMRKTYPWVTLADVTTFDWEACIGSEAKKIAFKVYQRPDLYDGHELEYGVRTVLNQLRDSYDRVIVVTSPFQQHASSKWAFCQRAGFMHRDIVMCGDKTLVDFDVLLDDRASTCRALGPKRAVVFDRPWNRGMGGFQRAYGWGDVPTKIERIIQEIQLVDNTDSNFTGDQCEHGYLHCGICPPANRR